MPTLQGIVVTSPIVPPNTESLHPSHIDIYGKGGFRIVNNLAEMSGIQPARRVEGMLVGISGTNDIYTLVSGIDNTKWTKALITCGHTHGISDITNFGSGVSGLLPINLVYTTSDQNISGVKTFDNGSNSELRIKTLNNGTGSLYFMDGNNHIGYFQWDGTNHNLIFDSTVENSTFDLRKKLKYKVPSTGVVATSVPVFTGGNPSVSGEIISSRSINDFKLDLSLNNVQNLALSGIIFTAGSGLVGGGSLSSDKTFDIGQGDGITVSADAIAVNNTVVRTVGNQSIGGVKTFTSQPVFNSGILVGGYSRFTIGGGGFDFSIDRGNIAEGFSGDILKFDVDDDSGAGYATTLKSNAPVQNIIVRLPDTSGTLALDKRDMIAGSGLVGGGTISADRTFNVGQGDGITVSTDSLSVDSSVVRTTGLQNISGIKTFLNNIVVTGQLSALSGYFTNLISINGTEVSLSGHAHSSSDITNFNSSVSGLISGIYAPLNSPALTGIPTAPTAISDTNTTQIATTAFVRTEVSNLINSAPTTLDTLNELAVALGSDNNFATTVATNIGTKVSKSGDTMSGNLTVPTGYFTLLNATGINISGSAAVSSSRKINTVSGITGGASLSGDLNLSLTGIPLSLYDLNNSGLLIYNGSSIYATGLLDGSNINISNRSGLTSAPTINLNTSITGISKIESISGIFSGPIVANNGSITNSLSVSGSLTLNGRDITTSIEAIQNTNTANFSLSVGSVTDVGSNGGPSYYGTFDQGGNVREIMHSGSTATVAMRGGNFASDNQLVNTYRASQTPTAEAPGFGFRLSSRENIGKSYPLTFNSTTITASGSVIHGFQLGDPLKFANDTGLPVALSSGVTYYVTATGSTTFSVGTGNGGAAISVIAVNGTTSAYSPYDYSSFVRVENSGNNANAGYGAVDYNYRIGKFEVTNDEYVEFLNAVARDDHDAANNFVNNVDMGLYSLLMETEAPNNGISRNASFPDYYYAALRGMNKKPVVFVSYMDAARYANWLHNGKPVSARYRVCLPISNNGVTIVALTNHGYSNGDLITFNCTDTSTFGSGGTLTRNTTFKVANVATNAFDVQTTGNGNVTFTGTGTFYVKRFFDKDNNVDKGAHTLSRDTTTAIAKNAIARYWVSTENEWYKAAYYDPAKSGAGSPGYWAYPTRSDTVPTPVSADSDGNGSYNGGGTIPSHNHSSYDISDFVDRIGGILDDGTGTQVAYNSTASSITVNVTGIPLSLVTDVKSSSTDLNYMSGVLPGTASGNTAVVLNSSKSISGISTLYVDSGIFSNSLTLNATGVVLENRKINTASGIGGGSDLSKELNIGLTGLAYNLSNINTSGIIVTTENNGVTTRTISSSGINIFVGSGNGVGGNPIIGLNPNVSGLSSLQSSFLYSNTGYFTGLFVSSSGAFLPVSLSGHRQSYSTIDNFCTGVAECVNTELLVNSGLQSIYSSSNNTLRLSLSGIPLSLYSLNTSGFIVHTGNNTVVSRSIINGNNININYGDGISGHPTISLSGSLDLIQNITSTGNLKASSGIFSSGISVNGTGVVLTNRKITTSSGIGGGSDLINDLTIGLTGLAYNLSNINTSGFIVTTGNNGAVTRVISASGINILIGSGNGLSGNPIIGLNPYTSGLNTLQASYLYSNSGNFINSLQLNGSGVSVTGHSHTVSDISNFGSGVSGLFPIGTVNYIPKFGNGGSGLNNSVIVQSGNFIGIGINPEEGINLKASTITASNVNFNTEGFVKIKSNRLWDGVVAGIDIDTDVGYANFYDQLFINSFPYDPIVNISGNLNINGTGVSLNGHSHVVSDITNFASSVSGLLPTGTANYLSKFGAGGSGLNDSLIFDNGISIGIGTSSPSAKLHVDGSGIFSNSIIINGNSPVVENRFGRMTPIGNISLDNGNTNFITFRSAGTGLCPTDSLTFNSGLKILLRPVIIQQATDQPPVAIGLSNNSLWHVVSNTGWNYEWNAGANNLATLSGNGILSVSSGISSQSASFTNNITASGFIKSGGTSSQFLKADGSVDSTTYQTNILDLKDFYVGDLNVSYISADDSLGDILESIDDNFSSVYNDNTVVRTTGNQGIEGLKDFYDNASFGGADQTTVSLGENLGPGNSGVGLFDGDTPLAAQYWQAATDIIHYAYGGGTLASPRIAVLESNGNVGIGTSSPSAKLHVNGSINVSNGAINVNDNSAYGAVLYSSGLKLFNNTIDVEVTQVDNNLGGYDFTPSGFLTANGRTIMGGGGPEIFSSLPEDGDIVLFSNFENSINNGIYRLDHIPDIDPEYPQYVFKGVRATSYTNGTSIPNGYRVKIAEINTSARFVLNRYDNGNSIIGTNSLIFEYDAGEAVMTIQNSLDVDFIAAISAKEKYFKIQHPNPDSVYSFLQYGSLESPYHGVRLTGKDKLKNGICEILLPDYLKYLIHEEDVSIQLTNHGHHKILYVDKIDLKNNKFIVKGYKSKSGGPYQFYWSFTGIRKDVPNLIPEQ